MGMYFLARIVPLLGAFGALATAEAVALDFQIQGFVCRDPDTCHGWVHAQGAIEHDSGDALKRFYAEHPGAPRVVRLTSDGGSLIGGLNLGEAIRGLGLDTEADDCASACVYALAGGIRRRLAHPEARIAIHQFYRETALTNPDLQQFTGRDLEATQSLTGILVDFTRRMGLDPQIVAWSSVIPGNDSRVLTEQESRSVRLLYEPGAWLPWEIRGGSGSVLAISTTEDGNRNMQLACSPSGIALTVSTSSSEDYQWLQQCANAPQGFHYVFGLQVANEDTNTFEYGAWGAIRFMLPILPSGAAPPTLFDADEYPMMCRDQGETWRGTIGGLGDKISTLAATCRRR